MSVFYSFFLFVSIIHAQVNQIPEFLPGGDMNKFSIREDTPSGTSVYTLKAVDPEETEIAYNVSSDFFAIDPQSGIVTLKSPLDRENQPTIHVNITATDEPVFGQLSNTVSLQREITILDQNDNVPIFQNLPYIFSVNESTSVGTEVYKDILVTDNDFGGNAEINLSCDEETTPEACKKFAIKRELLNAGQYRGTIILQESLDFETTTTYIIAIKAEDQGVNKRHLSSAIVVAEVADEQDLGPQFQNETYFAEILEESSEEKNILSIQVNDGDRGNPRQLLVTLHNDVNRFFKISHIQNNTLGKYLVTISSTGKPINREDDFILSNGGFYVFKIKATELGNGNPNDISSTAEIWVKIIDINDNPPIIDQSNITIHVPENFASDLPLPGIFINIQDGDFGLNSQFNLSIDQKNDYFTIDPMWAQNRASVSVMIQNGIILDYEEPHMRNLDFVITASHFNGESASVNVSVVLDDVNDHNPVFEKEDYVVHVPVLRNPNTFIIAVNATDDDSDLFGKISYEFLGIKQEEFILDAENGSIYTSNCAEMCLTIAQTYRQIIKASDVDGKFALATVKIIVEAAEPNNTIVPNTTEKISFSNSEFNTTIRETTKEGTVVARLTATSTNSESKIVYSIVDGAEKKFEVDPLEGILTVAPGAILDVNLAGKIDYNITVQASSLDGLISSTTQVYIIIEDVNNKPPQFDNRFYVIHINENKQDGDELFKLTAVDPDSNADLKYSLRKSLTLHDHRGNISSDTNNINIKDFLQINSSTGVISLIANFQLSDYFMINFAVLVEDLAAQTAGQSDSAEIVLLNTASANKIQWKIPKSLIDVTLPEEMSPGSQVLILDGSHASRGEVVFEKISESTSQEYFNLDPISGSLTIAKNIDYESIDIGKNLSVDIKISAGNKIIGNTSVKINIVDINDNKPIFTETNYTISVPESNEDILELLKVSAIDNDDGEFGKVIYNLLGDAEAFLIDENGVVFKKKGVVLDREKKPFYSLRIIAKDNPKDEDDQRFGLVPLNIEVIDVNDNSPKFTQNSLNVVVGENTLPGSSVLIVKATDADEGLNGVIKYSITNSRDSTDLFEIDEDSGVISVNQSLISYGRSLPYKLTVTARDLGTPSLISNILVKIMIGDLSSQDEILHFTQPQTDEIIYVSENDKEDLTVCHMELSQQNRLRHNMKNVVRFSLLDLGYGGSKRRAFTIDTDTGLITTRTSLDRETAENYTLIVAATQVGLTSQAYHIVNVSVIDTNDNTPFFPRPVNSEPLQMSVEEESPFGTIIGSVKAIDLDKGDNAVLLYSILDHEDNLNLFGINKTQDEKAVIYVKGRLDHEEKNIYNLLIQVQNSNDEKLLNPNITYDPEDLSQLQVQIHLTDIDDNPIQFISATDNLGVRLNAPRQSIVTTIQAFDPDSSDNPLQYFIQKVVFVKEGSPGVTIDDEIFFLEKNSGILRTAQGLISYNAGTFYLTILVKSATKASSFQTSELKIKLLQDSHMLKFVFQKPPNEVQKELRNINRDFQSISEIPQPITLQLADSQLNVKDDSFINADSTSICFQMVKDKIPIHLNEAQDLLNSNGKPTLESFYKNYNISNIGPCDQIQANHRMNWVEIFIIIIASMIAVISIISVIILCIN